MAAPPTLKSEPPALDAASPIRESESADHVEEFLRQRADLTYFSRLTTMGEIAAGLAHEINQPLSAIVNFARGCSLRIQSGVARPDDLIEATEEIAKQALRAGEIIQRLCSFVRNGAPRREPSSLNHLIEETLHFMGGEMRARGIALRLDLAVSLPRVQVDRVQIEQVVINLLRNGFDAMRNTTGNELLIHTAARSVDVIEVAVSDTGQGLDDRQRERMFDPFFTTKQGGLGIGLSISRWIIEAHGGHLWATPNPERGATFRFTLPTLSEDRSHGT